MKRLAGWMRIAILISILWLVFHFIGGLAFKDIDGVLFIAIIPILTAWVVWWTVNGIMPTKTDKAEDEKEDMDSVTKELRGLEVKVHKIASELSELEKTK